MNKVLTLADESGITFVASLQVNGILLSTPKQEAPQRKNAASSTLQAKLKSKQQDRKVKKKK